jgi:hypothetical protein
MSTTSEPMLMVELVACPKPPKTQASPTVPLPLLLHRNLEANDKIGVVSVGLSELLPRQLANDCVLDFLSEDLIHLFETPHIADPLKRCGSSRNWCPA